MSSLNDFVAQLKGGIAKSSHFSVILKPPAAISNDNNIKANMSKVLLFCEQAQLPGVSFSTNPVRSYGEVKEVPYEKLYEPITLSFYVDADMNVKRLFDQWVNLIQDTKTRTYNYPNTYMTDTIDILIYDTEDNQKYMCTLHKCFPKAVSPIQLDYNAKDVMRLQVTFSYKYFETVQISTNTGDINAPGIANPDTFTESLLNYGYGLASSIIPSNYFTAFNDFQNVVNNIEEMGTFSGWDSFYNI